MRRAATVGLLAALCGACGGTGEPPADMEVVPPTDLGGEGDPLQVSFEALTLPGDPTDPTALAFVPGRSELVLAEKRGGLFHYRLEGDELTLLGSFAFPDVDFFQECGVVGLAFDPDWQTNGYLYASHCLDGRTSRIVRVTFDGTGHDEVIDSLVEVYRVGRDVVDETRDHQHTMTTIGFDAAGALYASVGDRRVNDAARDPNEDLGSLIRIVPGAEGGSTPAPDNPYVDGGGSPNVFAKGLRSPWKVFLDREGRYWVGDVGGSFWEEVNLVTEPGQNFGWPDHEGPCRMRCDGVVDAVVAYDRNPNHPYIREDPLTEPVPFRSVWVGVIYTPSAVDRYRGWLTGRLLFGDASQGWVRVLGVDAAEEVIEDRSIGHLVMPTAWAQGPDDWIYVTAFVDPNVFRAPRPGFLYRMVPRNEE